MIVKNTLAHDAIRHENLQNPRLVGSIRDFARAGAPYVPCAGNLGDGLIGLGTLQLFEDLDLSVPALTGLDLTLLDGFDRVIVGGGGGWVDGAWDHYAKLLEPFLQRGGRALVLPSSVSGLAPFFERYARQMVFCTRERNTADHLKRVAPQFEIIVAHDLAFNIDLARLNLPDLQALFDSVRILRTDAESVSSVMATGAPDLPSMWNGLQWGSIERCIPPLQSVASILLQFKSVDTDRLHMAALAAMLGRSVVLRSNSYFKNQAVFSHSLCRFDQVTFQAHADAAPQGAVLDASALQIKLDMQSAEIQELRARVLNYATERDRMVTRQHVAEAPSPLLQAYLQSRGFRLWQHYLALYDKKAVGPALRQARRWVGWVLRLAKAGRV